jgi:DNA primase small subunit
MTAVGYMIISTNKKVWIQQIAPVPSKSFMNREFSFHLVDETFMRFQSFRTLDEFKKELIRMCPSRIDLGAVYNIRPKDKAGVRANAFIAVSKEMVFDIDMTDYDEIRTCCSGGDVCVKCWEFMTIAMKIIDAALREDFGFKHLLWVYSGRRGVHCWVGDERARVMTNDQRKAIVSYLEVVKVWLRGPNNSRSSWYTLRIILTKLAA